MKRRQLDFNAHFGGFRVFAALVLGWVGGQRCTAVEMALPEIGTAINYDFLAEQPIFEIANGVPALKIIQSEVTFAGHKHLRVVAESDLHFFAIHLTLRSPRIADLFQPIHISFDETMSLLREDGSIGATAKNTGVTSVDSCGDDCDEYQLSWGFESPSDFSIYGFKWSITPDLIQGKQLPETLIVDTYMWGGPIVVIPEPSCAVLVVVSIICISGGTRPAAQRRHLAQRREGAKNTRSKLG